MVYQDGSSRVYEYGDIRQLISARGYLSGGGSDTGYQYDYSYDTIGNYTNVTRNSEERVYYSNGLNQYASNAVPANSSVIENSYDINGNLLDDGEKQYVWNEESRLVRVTNGMHRTEYDYNGFGFRVERREYENNALQETIRYVYDGLNVIAETDSSNVLQKEYVLGLDLSRGFAGAGGIGGVLSSIDHSSSPSMAQHFLYDGNGNVTDLLDTNDVLVAHYEYDPFGGIVVQSGSYSTNNAIRFSSKYHGDHTGLVYYGYRFYSPALGRW